MAKHLKSDGQSRKPALLVYSQKYIFILQKTTLIQRTTTRQSGVSETIWNAEEAASVADHGDGSGTCFEFVHLILQNLVKFN